MFFQEGDDGDDIILRHPDGADAIYGCLFVKAITAVSITEMQQYGLAIVH